MLNIALFGPPGAGKGTQSEFLVKHFNLFYISTGDLLRRELAAGTRLGEEARNIIAAGGLVPDEIVVRLIEKKIANANGVKGFIFKGFPRTLVQSYILDGLLRKHGSGVSMVIDVAVPLLDVVQRLGARGKTDRRMPYDTSTDRIVKRLKEHETKTIPVIDNYRKHREVLEIDGTGDFEQVFNRLSDAVESGIRTQR